MLPTAMRLFFLLWYLYRRNTSNTHIDDMQRDFLLWERRARRRRRHNMLVAAIIIGTSSQGNNEMPRRRRQGRRLNIVSLDWWHETVCLRFNDQLWKDNFRMSKETFHVLCDILRPQLQRGQSNVGNSMSVEKVVGMTLWRLATPCDLRTIGNLFGVHRSTVCRAVYQVCQTIVDMMYCRYIVWPTGERLRATVQGFEEHGFPQCGGAIDGSHIPIKAPHTSTADYFNRKGFYSMILQAVVDHKLRFTDINVGWPGKVHDARVFRNSSIYERGERGQLFPTELIREIDGIDVPVFIIGDPAYPLLPWLIKGYSEGANFNRRQRIFNYRLSRARMVVERAFGMLKGRWRILMRRNDTDVSKVPLLVSACCVLHNFCIEQNDLVELEEVVPVNEDEPNMNNDFDNPLPDALDIRTALENYCNTHPL